MNSTTQSLNNLSLVLVLVLVLVVVVAVAVAVAVVLICLHYSIFSSTAVMEPIFYAIISYVMLCFICYVICYAKCCYVVM